MNAGTQEHIAFEMSKSDVTRRANVDVVLNHRIHLREDRTKTDGCRATTCDPNAMEKRPSQILTAQPWDAGQRLRRPFERAVSSQHPRRDTEYEHAAADHQHR